MISYLKRLAPRTIAPAIVLGGFTVVRSSISYFNGDVPGGTPLNIAARIAAVVVLIVALSFLWAAGSDWEDRRKSRKDKHDRRK